MTVSTALASAVGLAASLPPASTIGFALLAERFPTVTAWPTSISRAAIAAPIRPRPAIPTRMGISFAAPLCHTSLILSDDARRGRLTIGENRDWENLAWSAPAWDSVAALKRTW